MVFGKTTKRFQISDGSNFRLGDINPAHTAGLDIGKHSAKRLLKAKRKRLAKLQERLYAEGHWSVLIILQALDAGGKDSVIEHVLSGINPQGCEVTSFKVPSATELRHDFLWRTVCALPERGRIGVFNRSYYEEVLITRVHPELLAKQSLPEQLVHDHLFENRFESIRGFERHLARSGTLILKFFLHVSKDEQRSRFLKRIAEPNKHWKFAHDDLAEREHWSDYLIAYEDMIQKTAAAHAPWYVVPADNKWFTRLVFAAALIDRLEKIDPAFPLADEGTLEAMEHARLRLG